MINKEDRLNLLRFLDESGEIQKGDLIKKIHRKQKETGQKYFSIDERTETTLVSREISKVLHELLVWELADVEREWDGEFYRNLYYINEKGKEYLKNNT